MRSRRNASGQQCVGPATVKVGAQVGPGTSNGPAPTALNGEQIIEGSEGRLLNRIIRCTQQGWEVEPDQRHVDLIILGEAQKGEQGEWVNSRWRSGGKSSRLHRRARPWCDRVTITHALRASAHRRRVGRARERWGRFALLAVGVAPHARPRRPMLAPFASRHMQVANGAAQIGSGCVGELGRGGPFAALRWRVARNVVHWPPPATRKTPV